jgi:hypothetical protein
MPVKGTPLAMSDTTTVEATSTTTETKDTDLEGLGDKGKLTLIKIRDERDALKAARDAAEAELTTLRDAETKRANAERKAAEKKAQDDGEWERLATEREAAVTNLTTERDDFKAKYEKALETITPGVTAQWKDLPPEVTKMYRGDDSDVLAKHAFIADTADLVKTLTATTKDGTRVPLTPSPVDTKNGPSIEQTRRELAALRGVRR